MAEESGHDSSSSSRSDTSEEVEFVHVKNKASAKSKADNPRKSGKSKVKSVEEDDSEGEESGHESSGSEVSEDPEKFVHKKKEAVDNSDESEDSSGESSDSEASLKSDAGSVGAGNVVVVKKELIDSNEDESKSGRSCNSSESESDSNKSDPDGSESLKSSDSSSSGDDSSIEVKRTGYKNKSGTSIVKSESESEEESDEDSEEGSDDESKNEGKPVAKSSKSKPSQIKIDFSGDLGEEMKKRNKESSHNAVDVHLSKIMKKSDCGTQVVVLILGSLGAVWYMQAGFLDNLIQLILEKSQFFTPKKGKKRGVKISVKPISLRKHEHGEESLFRRTSGQRTIERILFVFEAEEGWDDVLGLVRSTIEALFGALHARKKNPAGGLLLDFINEMKPGLHNSLMQKHGGPDKQDKATVEKLMTSQMNSVFKYDPDFHYDMSLDKFMVDNDIKQILVNTFGSNSWDDVSEDVKAVCYKDYPGKKFLPEWDQIAAESYTL